MIPTHFLSALKIIKTYLEGFEHSWAITGSTGFALQGVPIQPRDIDLQTTPDGAYEMAHLFAAYLKDPVAYKVSEEKGVRSVFGAFKIDAVDVEIMGGVEKRFKDGSWQSPANILEHLHYVEYENLHLPVLDLNYELEAYRLMGRFKRAQMLAEWLQDHVMNHE
jgi:hypothetical protein